MTTWQEQEANQNTVLQKKDKKYWDPFAFFEIINCSHLQSTTSAKLIDHFSTVIGNALGITNKQNNLELLEKRLNVSNTSKNEKFKMVVLVLDEIDLLMAVSGLVPILNILFPGSLTLTIRFLLFVYPTW